VVMTVDDGKTVEQLHCLITGRVQGVGFRMFVQDMAIALGLTGWVRNQGDTGSVEMVAEGNRTDLQRLLDAVRQGPPGARVDQVVDTWSEASTRFDRFSI